MPRPKSFDENRVLKQTMLVFWKQGYAATSMRHIETATSLSAGSLYHEFGSKEKLFNRTLAFYIDEIIGRRIEQYLETEQSPLQGVREFLMTAVIGVPQAVQRQSCLLVNTATEIDGNDDSIGLTVKQGLRRLDRAFTRALLRAQVLGEVSATLDCRLAGRQLSMILPGLLLAAKNEASQQGLESLLDFTLQRFT